ncbi:MAG: hypothetical protein ACPGRD_01545, partial [Planktomarina sp.]
MSDFSTSAVAAKEEALRRIKERIDSGIMHWIDFTDITALEEIPEELAQLEDLQWVVLSGTQVSDLRILEQFEKLWHVELTGAPVTDVSPLANSSNLALLRLNECPISDVSVLASAP